MNEGSKELREQMNVWLPYIDDMLAGEGLILSWRPFMAASIMVEDIIKIEGDSKDDFFMKTWFEPIYRTTFDWYKDRYGEALASDSKPVGIGVFTAHGTPFEIRVPLKLLKTEKPGESVWVTLPNGVLPEENVRDWVTTPPNWSSLSAEELSEIDDQITSVGQRIRSIHMDLISVEFKDDKARDLAETIEPHIYEGASKIASRDYAELQLAFWEIHLATEKAMKLALMQQGLDAPRTHDLCDLRDLLASQGTILDQDTLKLLPSHEEVINLRYGTGQKNLSEAMTAYESMLDIVSACTASMERQLKYDNPSALMRIPFWMKEDPS
ncbi:MAG: hypothetical protein OXG87_10985 [Gemmatimonadetes bacterium]|nr:hypothetical protein [Gemmatimonadota bacterium]